ncbi:hypothetical protein PVK06_028680 [Gossypium arboreum]|uniref:Uncharacterized protein n=1 Tax=Gossypium arboreum TaxID=29729 RepID=A0ABR0P3V8_GOSAR|nr:hypothetical protein PVK06_028680 [Gossypium arboreum]
MPDSRVMNVMKNGRTTLEEQVASLAKTVESLTISLKGMDNRTPFMVTQIEHLSGSNQTSCNENQHQTLQQVGEIIVVQE